MVGQKQKGAIDALIAENRRKKVRAVSETAAKIVGIPEGDEPWVAMMFDELRWCETVAA